MNFKQIILIRSDLDMRCGKKCVQVSHASIMGSDLGDPVIVKLWKEEGMRKIVLKVKDLNQLMDIAHTADVHTIRYAIVTDLGLTQLEPNTVTCIGFAPLEEGSEKSYFLYGSTKDLSLL
jgi:peptidyl-tRNA hydrolase, PTH2 family